MRLFVFQYLLLIRVDHVFFPANVICSHGRGRYDIYYENGPLLLFHLHFRAF